MGLALGSGEGVGVGVPVGSGDSVGQQGVGASGSSVGVGSSVGRQVGSSPGSGLSLGLGLLGSGLSSGFGFGGLLADGTVVGPDVGSAAALAVGFTIGGRAPMAVAAGSEESLGSAVGSCAVDPLFVSVGLGAKSVGAAQAPRVGVDPSPVTSAVSKTVFHANTSRR